VGPFFRSLFSLLSLFSRVSLFSLFGLFSLSDSVLILN
jgi:hypothetical protein